MLYVTPLKNFFFRFCGLFCSNCLLRFILDIYASIAFCFSHVNFVRFFYLPLKCMKMHIYPSRCAC
nr:MAG TPA: hypothetical protein [Caudoviricetes sp.]